jgi:hypothetical protein
MANAHRNQTKLQEKPAMTLQKSTSATIQQITGFYFCLNINCMPDDEKALA